MLFILADNKLTCQYKEQMMNDVK